MYAVMGLITQVSLWQLGSAEFTPRAGGSLSSWVDSGKATPKGATSASREKKTKLFQV